MRLTAEQIIQRLRRAGDQYTPLVIKNLKENVRLQMGFRGDEADAIITFSIEDGPFFDALVEIAPVANPKSIEGKSRQLFDNISKYGNPDVIPMIIAPYIGAKQVKILADRGISWIDLSGNMAVRVSNRVYIERTGKPNCFPDTAPIKKIFQGTSSLVSRALLLKPDGFESLTKITDFITQRSGKTIMLSTVSKVLKKLEDELLINRSKSLITAANPEKLLERLAKGYKNSTERKRRNPYKFVIEGIEQLSDGMTAFSKDYIACGFYAAQIKDMAVTDQKAIFVKDIEQFRRKAEIKLVSVIPDAEYGNFIITETNDPGVWFNADWRITDSVVDDIELYLEMMVDTPRGPKIAEQLKRRILQKGDSDGQQAD